MIRIGLNEENKRYVIDEYLRKNDIKKVHTVFQEVQARISFRYRA